MKRAFILLAHANLASSFKESIQMVCGNFDNLIAIDFFKNTSYLDLDEKIKACYKNLENYDQIFIMTDIKGSTPFNRAVLTLKDKKNVTFICGMNFALVYYAITTNIVDKDEFIAKILEKSKLAIEEVKIN